MFHLLKIEWLKVKNYPTFWILIGLFAFFLPLFNYQFSSRHAEGTELLGLGYDFPNVWSVFGFFTSCLVLFIAFLIIILITNEHRYRTNRQNVIDGWTRMQAFHAKCLMILMLAILTTLYSGLWSLIFGRIYGGSFDHFTEDIDRLFYLFILCLNYYGFAAMIAFLIKRSGLAMGIFLLYALIVENILRWQLKNFSFGNFLPLQSSDELLPFSLFKQITAMSRGASAPELPSTTNYLIVSCIYIAIYYGISRYKLSKSDL